MVYSDQDQVESVQVKAHGRDRCPSRSDSVFGWADSIDRLCRGRSVGFPLRVDFESKADMAADTNPFSMCAKVYVSYLLVEIQDPVLVQW